MIFNTLKVAVLSVLFVAWAHSSEDEMESVDKTVYISEADINASVDVPIDNPFSYNLTVDNIALSCSCASHKISENTIPPKKTALLSLVYTLTRLNRQGGSENHECILTLSGGGRTYRKIIKILLDRTLQVSIEPKKIDWTEDQTPRQLKVLLPKGGPPLRLEVKTSSGELTYRSDAKDDFSLWFFAPKQSGMYFVVINVLSDGGVERQFVVPCYLATDPKGQTISSENTL